MSGGMYVNGFDVGLIGVTVVNVAEATPAYTPVTRKVYGRAGLVRTTRVPTIGARSVTVTVVVRGATVAAREANLSLLTGLFVADADVSFEPAQDRVLRCGLTTLAIVPLQGPMFLNTVVSATLSLTANDPYWHNRMSSGASISTAPLPVSLGTAPSAPLLRLTGSTNPVVTVRDAAGNAKQTLGFTITLAAGDYLEVDCEAMTIVKSVSGTVTDALSTLASGDFLVFDPADGVPTVEVSSGAGEALYRKAWL